MEIQQTFDDLRQNRAGRYIRQPTGYKAFIPAPLPPDPPLEITNDMYSALSRADRALGRLDGSIQTLPSPDLFVFMYVRKEAVLSSQIEGTQSSLQDLLEAEAEILSARHPRDISEVINYVSAMNHGLKRLEALPVSQRLIKEIHGKLLENVRGSHLTPGEFRRSQNWIGPPGCALNEAIFVPPPPDEISNALVDLEKFIHSNSDLPLLIQIALIHAQFETIHPFLDGNGRVGRLLITFLLCERKVLLKPVLYLSHYFKRKRSEYYDKLQSIRDRGDFEDWALFFLDGVAEVSRQATETARRILLMREEHRNLVTLSMGRGAANGYKVLDHLFSRPILSVKDVQTLTGTTYSAANDLVVKLTDFEIISEITGNRRNRLFQYDPYIRIFKEPDEAIDQSSTVDEE
ncbi:MAG: Fic family protein [Planctomycetes bacterium]|nr:Fic family protein [Planctomycetota bacterium]